MSNNIFDVVIEISKGSQLKYEIDKKNNKLYLDRILYGSNFYPQNYGFLPETLDYDNDPLDVVVVSGHSFFPTCIVKCKILGAIGMIDNGERDTKLIAVCDVDNRYKSFNNIKDLPKEWIDEIVDFFKNYKNLENKKVEINSILSLEETINIIEEGKKLYKNKS